MYSYEIEELLKRNNYVVSKEQYLNIIDKSKQINSIKYNPYEDNIEIKTNDNYECKIKIKTIKR